MADHQEIVPFNVPYDPDVSEEILIMFDDRNPTLEDLTIHKPIQPIQQQNPPLVPEQGKENRSSNNFQFQFGPGNPPSIPEQENEVGSSSNFQFVFGSGSGSGSGCWNPPNIETTTPNFDQVGPSEFHGESSNAPANSANFQAGNAEFYTDSELKILAEFPPTTYIFGCSCCHILREITHTNGVETTNLELHGQVGVIFHALFEYRVNNEANNPENKFELFDFSKSNVMEVREFLVQYCLERQNAGFYVVNDPLSLFYETICKGLFWAESPFHDEPFPPYSSAAEENPGDVQVESENEQSAHQPPPQQQQPRSLALQRQRTGKMTVRDVSPFFHLPIEEAARRLDLCPTVVKKICRRDGVTRWPHRRIKSLERQRANFAAILCSNAGENEKDRARVEIQRVEQEMEDIRQGRS